MSGDSIVGHIWGGAGTGGAAGSSLSDLRPGIQLKSYNAEDKPPPLNTE